MIINKPSLAVILVSWKKYDLTSNCIESLNRSIYKNFQIILVDNEFSSRGIIKLKAKHNELIVFKENKNLGFAGGNNIGIRYALENNTTGICNIAMGYYAMSANTTGRFNVGLGSTALSGNTTADSNVAIGDRALLDNTTGASNIKKFSPFYFIKS